MLLGLSSALRGRGGHANNTNSANNANTTPTRDRGAPEASADVVVGETPDGAKRPPASVGAVAASAAAGVSIERPSTAKKQRSIHDFFGSRRVSTTPTTTTHAMGSADSKPRVRATRRPSGGGAGSSSGSSRHDSQERIKKRIDYDDTSSLDENDEDEEDMMEDSLSLSENGEAAHSTPTPQPVKRSPASSLVSLVRPKRIDFGGICPSSQRSEPDVEPTNSTGSCVVETPGHQSDSVVRASSLSQSGSQYGGYGGYSAYGGGMFSQDDLDFCTPADQPVIHMSHPTTPSPLKKRPRRSFGDEDDDAAHLIQEDVQNLTDDMTHMDVRKLPGTETAGRVRGGQALAPLPSFSSSSDSNDLLLATPQRVLGLPSAFKSRRKDTGPSSLTSGNGSGSLTPFVLAKGGKAPPPSTSSTAVESFTNPFAPVPAIESRKRRKFRQSFPPSLGGSAMSVPYSRYLSEFVEQELLGSGAFSKVFKCVKKIDGWTYAIKKSKRHLRGRNDTERALREVQALAALSDSRHIVRYFDAWIEDDLLYIQLEHCASCSLATFVDAHKPLHVPEETLCKVLCHLAMALQDLHARHMVHLDIKLPNVLVAPGEVYKLGDLGTVALADGAMDITEGDNRYLSRELLEGSRANLKAGDVFALGATIYELALGATLPSGGEEWQKIRDGDLALFRQYTNSLQHLIASMMHPDPLQRPAADEILQHEVVRPYCH